MAIELTIKDRVLLKCDTDQKTVTIPENVQFVSKSAFDTCPNTHIINLVPEYVISELTYRLYHVIKEILHGWDSEYDTPCFPIYHIDCDIIHESLNRAIEKAENKGYKWNLKTLDCATIIRMVDAKSKGYDIHSLFQIPTEDNADGYGILFISGINKNNYNQLGTNFDYNLLKNHSFLGRQISPNWLVVLDSSVRLEPSDVLFAFGPDCCWMKNAEEYLKYMESINKIIE